ncbi:MAG: TetR/AcrR family transcriptional regulator [Anaerolineae bacterium]|nr:TetR/AcrR family transcriptional regulator [Anaerolineae bacterium]
MSAITNEESTRDRVIQAAHRLFIERGYHGTSMRQIAERAKIALGGIYNHFSSKENILAAVMVERNPYRDIVPALAAAEGTTAEALVRSAAAGMLAALRSRPDDLQLLFIEIVEFNGQHFPQLFESLFPQMIGFAQRLVQMNGDLRPISPPTLLRAFVGFFFAFFMTEWLMGDQFPSESQSSAFDDFVNIYLHGILKS